MTLQFIKCMSAANLRHERRKKPLKHPNCIPYYLMKQNIFGLVFLLKKYIYIYTHMFKHRIDMLPKSI